MPSSLKLLLLKWKNYPTNTRPLVSKRRWSWINQTHDWRRFQKLLNKPHPKKTWWDASNDVPIIFLDFVWVKSGLEQDLCLFSTKDDNAKSEPSPSKHPWSHVFNSLNHVVGTSRLKATRGWKGWWDKTLVKRTGAIKIRFIISWLQPWCVVGWFLFVKATRFTWTETCQV